MHRDSESGEKTDNLTCDSYFTSLKIMFFFCQFNKNSYIYFYNPIFCLKTIWDQILSLMFGYGDFAKVASYTISNCSYIKGEKHISSNNIGIRQNYVMIPNFLSEL